MGKDTQRDGQHTASATIGPPNGTQTALPAPMSGHTGLVKTHHQHMHKPRNGPTMKNPSYSVFQSDADLEAGTNRRSPLRALGFIGRVLEGAGIIVWSLLVSVITLTSTAQASVLLSGSTSEHSLVIATALVALMVGMLALVRRTWRHTTKGIENAPRRLHQIG